MKIVLLLFVWTGVLCAYEDYSVYREETRAAYNSLSREEQEQAKNYASYVEGKIRQGKLVELSDRAMTELFTRASKELKVRGYNAQASEIIFEWNSQYRQLLYSRDIGDHAPLSNWILEHYMTIELILGASLCRTLHLSDIMTFNSTINICLWCSEPVDVTEYGLHFIESESGKYRGLAPCVTWWITEIICMSATSGMGALFCGPVSMGTEYLMREYGAPKLSLWLWEKVCN